MKAERVCDECGKESSFIEFEHGGVTTQKSMCFACNWFHIVEDGREVFRGVGETAERTTEDISKADRYEAGIEEVIDYLQSWNDGWQTKVGKAAEMLKTLLCEPQ